MFKFFHVPKHYVFNYKPRFFDEKQKEREERFKKIKEQYEKEQSIKTNQNQSESYRPNISFRDHKWERRQKQVNASKMRLIIMIILALVLYLLFFSNLTSVIGKFFK